MLLFEIRIENEDKSIEKHYWDFVNNNETCTVQPSCEYDEEHKQWILIIVPHWEGQNMEFLQLCQEMTTHFEELGYEF